MSTKNELIKYHEDQESIIQNNADFLRDQGFVKCYKDVYPDVYDRIKKSDGVAYLRGKVPLKLLSLIYDTVIVYIPPISTSQLQQRFGMTYDEIIMLCQQNIVIPIIGRTVDYTASHFRKLFDLPNPPYSLWARGLALLDVFGMSDRLKVAKEALPVERIAQDPQVTKYWERKIRSKDGLSIDALQEKIQDEVAVLYADLCIFGCENDASLLSDLAPYEIYTQLKMMNEIRTYPILFGLESQPNYNQAKLDTMSTFKMNKRFDPLPVPVDELEILFGGIGINVDGVSIEDIVNYHSDGLGIQLRHALSSFNTLCNKELKKKSPIDTISICDKAELFQNKLKGALRELTPQKINNIDQTNKHITQALQIGSVALGALLPTLIDNSAPQFFAWSLGGAAATILLSLPDRLAEFITKLEVSGFQSQFMANVWMAKRTIRGEK